MWWCRLTVKDNRQTVSNCCCKSGNIPKHRVVRSTSILSQSYDLHDIRLTQKEASLKQKYVTGRSMCPLTPSHSCTTSSGAEAFTSTTIFKKCGGKHNNEDNNEDELWMKEVNATTTAIFMGQDHGTFLCCSARSPLHKTLYINNAPPSLPPLL